MDIFASMLAQVAAGARGEVQQLIGHLQEEVRHAVGLLVDQPLNPPKSLAEPHSPALRFFSNAIALH